MIDVSVQAEESFERIRTILHGVPGGVKSAIYNVISRATTTARATTIRGITSVYDIKGASVRGDKDTNILTKTLYTNDGVAGFISFSGKKIPLIKFGVSHKTPKHKQPVKARLRKDEPMTEFNRAFVADMPRYGIGLLERESYTREPTTRIMGLATAQMASDSDVLNKVETEAVNQTIVKRTEHEITRILKGYGR